MANITLSMPEGMITKLRKKSDMSKYIRVLVEKDMSINDDINTNIDHIVELGRDIETLTEKRKILLNRIYPILRDNYTKAENELKKIEEEKKAYQKKQDKKYELFKKIRGLPRIIEKSKKDGTVNPRYLLGNLFGHPQYADCGIAYLTEADVQEFILRIDEEKVKK